MSIFGQSTFRQLLSAIKSLVDRVESIVSELPTAQDTRRSAIEKTIGSWKRVGTRVLRGSPLPNP
jgi:hypothetical protein